MIQADDAMPFVILAYGRFAPERLHLALETTPRESTPKIDAAIAATWDKQLRAAQAAWRVLFNGDMLRYIAHDQTATPDGDALALRVGPTNYRDFVGTNLFNRHRVDEFGWHRFSNPIGTTATILTTDGFICYGRRSRRVSYHANHVHTFGGALEACDAGPNGRVDAFASVLRELHEELALERSDIREIVCAGLIRDREIHQPEMLFEARVALTADELTARWQTAESRDEHEAIVRLRDDPDAIAPFLATCGPIAPVAVGALMLYGRNCWGAEWYKQCRM
jgi:8-oxo-dGTP pyrophosphatase MutT (NUDIX family)